MTVEPVNIIPTARHFSGIIWELGTGDVLKHLNKNDNFMQELDLRRGKSVCGYVCGGVCVG